MPKSDCETSKTSEYLQFFTFLPSIIRLKRFVEYKR